jgi:autotransporter strand-loop-strand O-heptosyltransferase
MLYRNDTNHDWSPSHYRYDGLHHYVGLMLGLPLQETPPRVAIKDGGRPIAEPYVCIAVQASSVNKKWLNPTGWDEVVDFLKAHGYRVVCIDHAYGHGVEGFMHYRPEGAEDRTGDIPLTERGRWIRHADFFIGVSSGLAWLGWAVGAKVVLISGFTHPRNEFMTPYRVINFHVCNSCWNDAATPHSGEQLFCPRHQGTERQFECSRAITGTQVINTIRRIPGFPATA